MHSNTIPVHLPVKMIAHRGMSGLERENTAAAFVAAGNRSHFGVETDVHLTADGRFIIIHDDTTDRVTGVHHVVEETDFAALHALYLTDLDGSVRADLVLPALEEYIRICKKYGKHSVLELKNHMPEEAVARIIAAIREMGHLEATTFISFDLPNCLAVRRMLPDQGVQYLTSEWTDELPAMLHENSLDLDIDHAQITKERVDACHAMGIKVNVWTVDDEDEARRAADCGVDYITSNILE